MGLPLSSTNITFAFEPVLRTKRFLCVLATPNELFLYLRVECDTIFLTCGVILVIMDHLDLHFGAYVTFLLFENE